MTIPNDPVMLLSYLNTQLRDHYPSFTELCQSLMLDEQTIQQKLTLIGYEYDPKQNRFL